MRAHNAVGQLEVSSRGGRMEQPEGGFQVQLEDMGRAGLGQHLVPCTQRERGGHQSGGCSVRTWGAVHS